MQLTRERAITLHRRMWRWIGLKTLKEKRCVKDEEWFEKFRLKIPFLRSYCCEYNECNKLYGYLNCRYCLIDWGGRSCVDNNKPGDKQGLYGLWLNTVRNNDWQKAGDLALQIAELTERKVIASFDRTLEDILMDLGANKPFLDEAEETEDGTINPFTKEGTAAYDRLIELLHSVGQLTSVDMEPVIKELDNIAARDY